MQYKIFTLALITSICIAVTLHAYSEATDHDNQNPQIAKNPDAGTGGKNSSQDQLASEIKGAIVYSRYHQIYRVTVGDWEPIELCPGEYARWSPDGEKIAVYDKRKIFVINPDGSNHRLVTDEGWSKHGCPIEFHTNGREIVFVRRNKRGFWLVDINTGEIRKLADLHDYAGEPGISVDGTRMACRVGGGAYAVDLANNTDFKYVDRPFACSSGISPDGLWLMNNRMGHKGMEIRSWDGSKIKYLRASICQPDAEWDNHHWSNHNDYICAQGGKRGETYVIRISAKRGTRVTWVGNTVYPDLYVLKTKNAIPSTISPDDQGEDPTILVNKKYNRINSKVLIRCVPKPTRANLDYAAYDSNVMHHDPAIYNPSPPQEQALSDLHFDQTLIPGSLRDRLDETPLTPAEKAAPMAWEPMIDYLLEWDFDLNYPLAEAGWKISEETWNDNRVPRAYQEISRVYLHKNEDGKYSIWVRVEFKPWVKFFKNVDDEDNDGFPEIYGVIAGQIFNGKIIQQLASDYTHKVLSVDEIANWGSHIAANWYDKYNTAMLEPEHTEVWPNAQTEQEVKAEIGELTLKQPDVIIRGKPFGTPIYNVFLTGSCRDYSSWRI